MKKKALETLKKRAKTNDIDLYFQDESGFSLTSCVPYAWQPRGQSRVISSSKSPQLNVIGFLSPRHDFKSMLFTGAINTDCVSATIDALFPTVNKETWIVMDNAPTHTSQAFKNKIKKWACKNIHFFFLPPYSPQLNLAENLWRFIKYQWLPLKAYEGFNHLKDALNDILINYGKKYVITFA